MINIRNAAGVSLVIDPDQHLTLEQAAGWLQDDTLPGAKSYPISFPITPNEAFLSSGYRPDAAKPVMEFPVTAQFQNVLYRRCLFTYEINEGKGSAYLKIDGGEVFSKLRKLKLSDALNTPIDLGTNVSLQLPTRMRQIADMKPGQFPLTFFTVRNELFFEEGFDAAKLTTMVRQPYVNAWYQAGFRQDSLSRLGYPIVPFFYLSWVIEQLFAKAGYSVEGDWLADPNVKRLVILNMTAIDARLVSVTNLKSHTVKPGQHLPDMQVGDFLKAIRQRYGLMYTFNSTRQVVTIRRFTDVVKSKPVDLTQYIVNPDKYGIKPPSNQGFSVVDYIDSADELYRDTKQQTIIPKGLQIGGTADSDRLEVKLGVGSCQQILEPGFLANTKWVLPTVRQAGNMLDPNYYASDRYPTEDGTLRNQMGLRIISYLGVVPSSNGAVYPCATPADRDGRQQEALTASSSLTGKNGLWQTILRNFYYFRDQTREVTVDLNLPTGVAAALNLHEPISLALSGQSRRSYLIEKLRSESPGPSGIMESKLYAYSIPDGLDLSQQVEEPHFYVQMTAVEGPFVSIAFPMPLTLKLTTYTLSYWLDAAKTQPAGLVNRSINMRRIRKGIPGAGNQAIRVDFHEESVVVYPAIGSGGPLDPAAAGCAGQSLFADVISYYLPDIIERNPPIDAYTLTLQLDPGEGYTVLP
ncbi:hypothetical protein [Spirosoma oryzicola]|uniref:hypothetical protein n=1 Tax=Spirosoma oryzicola TaxID=2898794 RepID=UPI001E3248EF|nr:hypothetical protein [Spirosoma oryzicola]UHG93423.1 hypothetical protein LQ777_11075 [Spirosoma oryzicola]